MAAEELDEVIVYAFVDENRSSTSLEDSAYHQDVDISSLFKLKVAELQELIQMMPDKQKLALWDYWDAAQKFVNSCFKNLMMDISIPEKDEHIDASVKKPSQEPVSNQLPNTSGPYGAPNFDVPPINCKVETLSVPETYLEVTKQPAKEYEEMTGSPVDKDDEETKKNGGGSCMWETETVKAAEVISETESNSDTGIKTGVKEIFTQHSATDMSSLSSHLQESAKSTVCKPKVDKENMSNSDTENVVHVQVEKIDGKNQNITVDDNLSIDENDPVIILQNEDVFNEYMAEENSKSKKLLEPMQKLESIRGKRNFKKTKKGRPKRKEFSEMCLPVTKEDGTNVFQCELCGVLMAHYPNMEVHLRSHTGQRPFRCSKCPKMFTTKGNMKEHEATHDTNRPQYECERCGKLFKQLKCLRIHSRIHTGEKPYKCQVCEKSFSQPGILQSHRLTHTDQKNHQCITCGKCFRLKAHLELHKKRHEDRRDFKCEECSFETITRSDLLRHMATHTGEKRFCCTVCQKKFTRANYLREHMNIHEGRTPYCCLECDASFSLATKLYSHKRKHRRELAEKLLREAQVKNYDTQSVSEEEWNNQSVSLKIEDRHVEIKNVNHSQTGILKLPENVAKRVKCIGSQSGSIEIQRQKSLQVEKELLVISHSGSTVQTNSVKDSAPQVTENLWAGDEQYVELVIGQDISVEDLNTLISSKVISFRQAEESLIETTDVPISMQE